MEVPPSVLSDILAVYADDWRSYGDTGAAAAMPPLHRTADLTLTRGCYPCMHTVEAAAAAVVLRALRSLSRAGRFSLTASLMGGARRADASRLFDQLAAASAVSQADDADGSEAQCVRELYGV